MSPRISFKLATPVLSVLVFAALSVSSASAGEKHVVSQKGKTFSVTELHVKVGDTVEFKNDDDVSHNVFSVSKSQPFNTKMQTPGSEAAVTFTTEGTVEVRCAIHPGMKLTVQVAKVKTVRLVALLVATVCLPVAPFALAAAPKRGTVTRTIHVKLSTTGGEVMFDQQRLELPFAKNIRLRYKNDAPLDSQISHNVAIIRPERVASVMTILQEHDYDLASVKGSPDILAITRVLNPGQEDVITFAPPSPGEYVYICLMPGHGDMLGMRGVLSIKN